MMINKAAQLFVFLFIFVVLATSDSLALTKLAKASSAPEQRISNEEFFRTVDFVDSTLGVGIQGLVGQFFDDFSDEAVPFAFAKARISTRNEIACIQIEELCWSLGVELETAVRIAHWVAQGKWRAFTCISVNDTENAKRIQNIVEADGLIDLGKEKTVGCGNNFVHSSLNSPELINALRIIDFNWFAFDRGSCSTTVAATLNRKYDIETRDPSSVRIGGVIGSWVNLDFDESYEIGIHHDNQEFELLKGGPKRYLWSRAEGELPHISEVCSAIPFSLHEQNPSAASRALRVFVVAAIFRTWSNQEYEALVDAVNEHAEKYN